MSASRRRELLGQDCPSHALWVRRLSWRRKAFPRRRAVLGQDCPSHASTGATPFLASPHRRPCRKNPRRQECRRTRFGGAKRPCRRTMLGQDCLTDCATTGMSSHPFWRRRASLPTNGAWTGLFDGLRDDRNVVAPVLASQSVPTDGTMLGQESPSHLERPTDRLCDDRNVVAPVLASQSVLRGNLKEGVRNTRLPPCMHQQGRRCYEGQRTITH